MPTDRTTVRRLPERGDYDRETIDAIIDEALICHVGFNDDEGRPVVVPTIHARSGDVLYFHGSPASRMLRTMSEGGPVCVTVTHVDGIVVARAPFHMSMNYRSVVVFGEAHASRLLASTTFCVVTFDSGQLDDPARTTDAWTVGST